MREVNVRPVAVPGLVDSILGVINQVRGYHDGVRWPRLRADGLAPAQPAPPATEAEAWERLIAVAQPGYSPRPHLWGKPATLGRAAWLRSGR